MKRQSSLACLHTFGLLAVATLQPAGAAEISDTDSRTLRRSFDVASSEPVHIRLDWGKLEIEPTDGNAVEVVVVIECRKDHERCAERLADCAIEGNQDRGRLDIEVTGLSRWSNQGAQVRFLAKVPRQQAVVIDMGAGEIVIAGLRSDLEVDLGAGEINVRMSEETVRRVELAAGVGDTRLRRANGDIETERAHLIGSSVDWNDGPGRARLDLRVGAGEVAVLLD